MDFLELAMAHVDPPGARGAPGAGGERQRVVVFDFAAASQSGCIVCFGGFPMEFPVDFFEFPIFV